MNHLRQVDVHVTVLLIRGRFLQHADQLFEILFGKHDYHVGVLRAQVSFDIDDLPVEDRIFWLVKVLEEIDEVACDFEIALPDQRDCAHFLAVLQL